MYKRPVVIGGVVMNTVEDVAAAFIPSADRARRYDWDHNRPVVQRAILAVGFTSLKATRDAMGTVVSFLCWAASVGLESDLKALSVPTTVEQFFEMRLKTTGRTRTPATRRSVLFRISKAVNPKAGWLPEPKPDPRKPVLAPDIKAELDRFAELIDLQPSPTDAPSRSGDARLGLRLRAVGCGELLRVVTNDVERNAGDVLLVHVEGDRERWVPVLAEYRQRFLDLVTADEPDSQLIGSLTIEQGDPISKAIAGIEMPAGEQRPNLMRLRNTWMVAVLNTRPTMPEFLYLAGLKTMGSAVDLAGWVTVRNDDTWANVASGRAGA